MNIQKAALILVFLALAFKSNGQNVNLKDSSVQANLIIVEGMVGVPAADFSERFGLHGLAGLGWQYKAKNNLVFGVTGHYLFGNTVKDENLVQNIKTETGYIIGTDGQLYNPVFFEQGFDIMAEVGGITSLFSVNPNSGLAFNFGIGYLQHNIEIFLDETIAPQLSGDYKKGYDKLTGGIQFSQFVGYYLFSNKAFVNFRAGFEFRQAITQDIRGFSFDGTPVEEGNRLDMMINFKASWILPIYKKTGRRYYSF